ncbi:unnamed protein product [Schistosoma haematobium]|nr:unnamed protein product [Schistosoma haematobium]
MFLNTNRPFDILNRSGFDKQYEEYKQGMYLTQSVMSIFQEKCELQSNYSRALSGLSGRLRDALAKTTGGTVHIAWLRIANAFEIESKLHEKFVQNLLNGLIKPLNNLIEIYKKNKKSLKKCVDKETNNLFSLYEMEFHARHKLFTCFRNYERVCYNYHIQSRDQQKQLSRTIQSNNDIQKKRSLSMNRFDTSSLSTMDSTNNSLLSDHYSSIRRNSIDVDTKVITTTLESYDTTTTTSNLTFKDTDSSTSPYFSSRSSTLYTSLPHKKNPNIIRYHSSLSSRNGRKFLTIDKLKDAYNTTLTHYYRTCLSAEEARIDWHSRILKCLNHQQILENDRLNSLTNGLTVYRNTLDDTLPTWKAVINEVANAISLADPLLDLQNFRQRSHHQEDLSQISPQQSTNSVNKQTDSPIKSKNVGCSLQRLIDLPCENVLLQQNQLHQSPSSPSSKSQALNIICRRKSQTSVDRSKENTHIKFISSSLLSPSSPVSLRLIIQHYLSKSSILTLIDMLTKDIEKERRTKRGLSNLVQVYAHQPAYTDIDTLMESRHRLYFSRVRLTYLLLCRQKLTHSLKQIHLSSFENIETDKRTFNSLSSSSSSPLSSENLELSSILVQAGFSKMILTSRICSDLNNTKTINNNNNNDKKSYLITSRWIRLPDLDRITNHGLNLMEWPPFPLEDITHENLNDNIFQLDIEKIREQLKSQSSWILDCMNNSNSDSHNDTNNANTLSRAHFTVTSNNNIITDKYQHVPHEVMHNQFKSPIKRSVTCSEKSVTFTSTNSILNSNIMEKSNQSLKKPLHGNSIDISNNDKSLESNKRFSIIKQSSNIEVSRKRSPEICRIQSERTDITTMNSNIGTIKNNIDNISKHSILDHSINSHKPIVPLATDETDTEDSINKHCSSISSVPYSSSISSENTENSKEVLTTNSFWSRLSHGLRGSSNNKQQSNHNKSEHNIKSHRNTNNSSSRKEIVKSEISEPSCLRIVNIPNSSCSLDSGNTGSLDSEPSSSCKSVHFHTGSIVTDNYSLEKNSSDLNLEVGSSSNLHCLGWAKVQRSYLPRNPTEIHLQEGDIISIYRKVNSDWWYGEVNNKKGLFPVDHIEEF